jgi:15-cis-phytoene synthase
VRGLRRGPATTRCCRPCSHRAAFNLDESDFVRFLDWMAMDLTVDGYATYRDLCGYMEGSAAVIGR